MIVIADPKSCKDRSVLLYQSPAGVQSYETRSVLEGIRCCLYIPDADIGIWARQLNTNLS
jgi:hypothetical protein